MTKFTFILSALALLAITVSAAPAPAGGAVPGDAVYKSKRTVPQGVSPNFNASPNAAQVMNYETTVIEARQYHNADYGAGGGPTGNPQPAPAETSTTPTGTTQQASVHTFDGTQQPPQNERRAVLNSFVARATPASKRSYN